MSYRHLLVVLDAMPHARDRLLLAARLAERFNAHLIGLYAKLLPEVESEIGQSYRGTIEEARALFEEVTAHRSFSAEWRSTIGSPGEVTALHGRYVDLVILGQYDPDEPHPALTQPRPEEVALMIGRPILITPYIGGFADVGRRVLVGWDASREATRAVNDAMPLLAAASSVTVLSIDPKQNPEGHGDIPGADIALHLARHGVAAEVQSTVSAGIGIGNTVLSRESDLGADLLVMGAYGHSRTRELLLGGATRTVLNSMTLPVLMAH
jgi:nucleotide-binding universal stress UspA family protein